MSPPDSMLSLAADLQRCNRDSKDADTCNTLNEKYTYKCLDIMPMPQFSFPSGLEKKKASHQQIVQRYLDGNWNPDWTYGERVLIDAAGQSDADCRPIAKSGCGLISFTMALRYFRLQGETETFYEKIIKDLKPDHRPPRVKNLRKKVKEGNKVKMVPPTTNDKVDWGMVWDWTVPDGWYPVKTLWWLRQQQGITKKKHSSKYSFLTSTGVLTANHWPSAASREAKKAKKEADKSGQAVDDSIQNSNVPKPLRDLGLTIPQYALSGAYSNNEARKKIVNAINEGLPVLIEFPGHYSLIIGWIKENGKALSYIVNNPGDGRLQHLVPLTKAPASYQFGKYYVLKPAKPIDPRWLTLETSSSSKA